MELDVRGIPIHYQEHGEGLPLVALHGFPTDHRAMAGMLEPLLEGRDGIRRIYFDLPGMGRSPGADRITGSDQMLDAVVEFVDRLLPQRSFLIAGQSYGGYLARGLLHRRPARVAGMLLVAPMFDVHGERVLPEPFQAVVDDRALGEFSPEERAILAQTMAVQTEAALARVRDEIFPGMHLADPEACDRIRRNYGFGFDPDDLGAPVDAPVLIVTGRHDAATGYDGGKRLTDLYRRVTWAVLDDAGHGVHLEQPTLFAALVDEWLARVRAHIPTRARAHAETVETFA